MLIRHRTAFKQFLVRSISRRYRMSSLGFVWTLLTPLITLAIHAFVFGYVMPVQMDVSGGPMGFTVRLFAGLIVFWLMAETINHAPGAVIEQTNLVKKCVFPLEIIPAVAVGSALFHTAITSGVLLVALAVLGFELHPTVVWLPVVLIPQALLLLGLTWFLSAIGVYLRDLGHIVALMMTGALFLSPVFYDLHRLPLPMQEWIMFNPITVTVIQLRAVVLDGKNPDWAALGTYFLVAWVIAALGLAFFRHARKNFADVL